MFITQQSQPLLQLNVAFFLAIMDEMPFNCYFDPTSNIDCQLMYCGL